MWKSPSFNLTTQERENVHGIRELFLFVVRVLANLHIGIKRFTDFFFVYYKEEHNHKHNKPVVILSDYGSNRHHS